MDILVNKCQDECWWLQESCDQVKSVSMIYRDKLVCCIKSSQGQIRQSRHMPQANSKKGPPNIENNNSSIHKLLVKKVFSNYNILMCVKHTS